MNLKWKIAQWFELRWWRNYLHGKNKQQYLHWKKNYWLGILSRVEDVVKLKPTQTIADLGCGPAGIFIALPQNKITAVDPLLNQYENQLPFFIKADYPNTNFVCSAIEDFNSTQKFDVVFCMNAINHVADIEHAYNVVCNSVVQNGKLVISIDAHNHTFFKYLFRLIPGDMLHPHQYSLDEYRSFMHKRGMKILKIDLVKSEFFFGHYLIAAGY